MHVCMHACKYVRMYVCHHDRSTQEYRRTHILRTIIIALVYLEVWSEHGTGNGGVAAAVAEDAAAYPTVVATDEDTELDVALRALLAGFVWHPVLLEVSPTAL